MAIVKIMKFAREEEIVANSLKIIRYCIKEENVSLKKYLLSFTLLIYSTNKKQF